MAKTAAAVDRPSPACCDPARRQQHAVGRRDGRAALVNAAVASPGQTLDGGIRSEMEHRLGRDFSQVRVHSDARSAAALDASAYTVGHHVVFAAGQYAPASEWGQELIAHELVHVAQQAPRPGRARAKDHELVLGAMNDPLEQQADDIAAGSTAKPVPVTRQTALIQRAPARRGPRSRRRARGAPATARRPPIVDDGQRLQAGQMHKSEFLAKLHAALVEGCDAELAPFGRTARRCPYIDRTIERYRGRPASSLLRVIRAWAHPPEGASPEALIAATTERARGAARRVGERQADRGHRPQAMRERSGDSALMGEARAIRSQLGSGERLHDATRAGMEQSFGRDFASVRVHSGPVAARFNEALRASAFTIGDDIAFAAGKYRPGTPPGDRLIAHELAHTIQQQSPPTASRASGDELERQADRAASSAVAGSGGASAAVRAGQANLGVQRGPVVVAGALFVAELAPEAAVVAEVTAVSTEVAVVEGAVVTTAELAPAVAELAPVALESTIPAALPAAVETTAAVSSSSAFTTAAVVGTGLTATTLSSDSPEPEEEEEEPCERRLPISWPVELPYPRGPRMLRRTPSVEREWEGIDRAADQSRLAREINRARAANVPPPMPCDESDAEPNARYHAHHRHPLYLGGEEAPWNLCALEAGRHERGHPRLNNQLEHLPEYQECGLRSGYLSHHPAGQEYDVVASK
jgi:hypothetical protein